MKVSHVIPCYENVDLTMECLSYFYKNTPPGELIIVDDGSTEEYPCTEDFNPDIFIAHKNNMGFPKSVNDGIKVASGDLIAVWNNDILVAPGWLEPIIAAFNDLDNQDYGMLGPKIYEPSSVAKEDFFLNRQEGWNSNLEHPLMDWHKGCPWVFKREVFKYVGYFDEQFYPTQYEDTDFLLRMALFGYKHAVVSNAEVFHYSAFTQNTTLKERFNGFGYANKNRERFEKKWGTCHISFQNAYEGKGVAA